MALRGVLANLLIRLGLDSEGVRKGTKKTKGFLGDLRTELTRTRSAVGLLAGATGFGFAAKKAFDLGAAVAETGSKFNTVFGPAAEDVQKFIDQFGEMAGLTDEAAQGILATTGSIVQGLGFSGDAAAAFSVEVGRLAGDLASFNNIPIEETSRAIQAALTGERESLKRLGIVVQEVDVQQRAMANSGKESAAELTKQEKAAATLQLVMERAGVAVGDLSRTQESAANQAKALGAELRNLRDDMVVDLQPAFVAIIGKIREFIGGIKLLGVDAAVGIAKFRLEMAKVFGDDGDFKEAAREAREEILGMADTTGEFADSSENLATVLQAAGGLGGAITDVTDGLLDMDFLGNVAITVFEDLEITARASADAVRELDEQLNKVSGALGGLRGLGRVFGFDIPGLGSASGLLGSFKSFAGLFADGGNIPSGSFGVVGEQGPELVSGPATVTPMSGGGDMVVNLQIVSQDGRVLHDNIEVRRARAEKLGRIVRVPVPLGVVS
jgi:hypothetical protein